MKAILKRALKGFVERALHRYDYRLVNAGQVYGLDFIADIDRLARAYGIDIAVSFDVGANIGRTSLAFRRAWPHATLYAFEPSPPAALSLRRDAGVRQPFHVEQLALGDRDGPAPFYVHEDAPDLNSLHDRTPFTQRFDRHAGVDTVEVATLDRFCTERRIDRINVLKIDTEGSDYDVLVGAADLLSGNKIDFVYCEFNAFGGRLGALTPIAELLGRHGFHFVASYNDYITVDGDFFAVSNALFAAPPRSAATAIPEPGSSGSAS